MKVAFSILIFLVLLGTMIFVNKLCKNKTRIILLSVLTVITLYFTIVCIDANRVVSLKKPIFVWKTSERYQTDNENAKITYQGLGYKIEIEQDISKCPKCIKEPCICNNEGIVKIDMTMLGKVIAAVVNDSIK